MNDSEKRYEFSVNFRENRGKTGKRKNCSCEIRGYLL